ncbi:hypothetical protein KEG38_45215 [Polyangium jinanense]|nr:hypothetical protein [Polyangium jinanense]MDC3961110.1 hypothetical protein [Polyangium jinanense]
MSVVLAGLALLACKQGERAEANGKCPIGETCSDLAPTGLVFVGAHTVNDADEELLLPTAIGGTQTVTVYYATEPNVAYVAGFDATLVDSRIATLESTGPTSLVLRGASEGEALLRLLEPGTNKLLDRVKIASTALARMSLIPRELRSEKVEADQWAVLAGNPAELGILLFDSNDVQVVDEGLDMHVRGADISRRAWDRYEVRATSQADLSITVRAGGQVSTMAARVASSIDDIVLNLPDTSEGARIKLTRGASATTFCFLAKSEGRTVVGAKWKFEPSETVVAARPEPSSEDAQPWAAPPWIPPSCVALSSVTTGRATLKVTTGNQEETFDIEVSEPPPGT